MGVCAQNFCYHVAAIVIFFNLICNMFMFLKKCFDLLTPSLGWGGGVVGLRAKYLLTCWCILDSLLFDMLHDYVLKNLNCDLLTPSTGRGGGLRGSVRKLFATMLVHS